jgi:hypothetical protein
MLGFGQAHGFPYVMPDPSGGFDTELERTQLVYLYAGISPSGVLPAGDGSDMLLLLSRRRRR